MKITDKIVCTACKNFGDGKTLATHETHETEGGRKLCDKHYEEWFEANDPTYVAAIEAVKNRGSLPEGLRQQYKRGLITPQETAILLYERGLITPQEFVATIP